MNATIPSIDQTAARSPLPWVVDEDGHILSEGRIVGRVSNYSGAQPPDGSSWSEANQRLRSEYEANVTLLMRATLHHDRLVGSLKCLVKFIELDRQAIHISDDLGFALALATKILRDATAETPVNFQLSFYQALDLARKEERP